MDLEPEVARHQMEDTRASLSDKLETLEQHVVDTVQGATGAVTDTVENVKDAVQGTVKSVQNTLNLRRQVRRHPWVMMVGSITLGYLGGYLLFRRSRPQPGANGWKSYPTSPDSPRTTAPLNGLGKRPRSVEETPRKQPVQEAPPAPSEPGWLGTANHLFGPEIAKLEGMAIGTVLSVVRDLVTQSVPEHLKPELAEVMDSITAKLGGEPRRGLASQEDPGAAHGPAGVGTLDGPAPHLGVLDSWPR